MKYKYAEGVIPHKLKKKKKFPITDRSYMNSLVFPQGNPPMEKGGPITPYSVVTTNSDGSDRRPYMDKSNFIQKYFYKTVTPDDYGGSNVTRLLNNVARPELTDEASEEAWRIYNDQPVTSKHFSKQQNGKYKANRPALNKGISKYMLEEVKDKRKYSKEGINVSEMDVFAKGLDNPARPLGNFKAGVDTVNNKVWYKDTWDIDPLTHEYRKAFGKPTGSTIENLYQAGMRGAAKAGDRIINSFFNPFEIEGEIPYNKKQMKKYKKGGKIGPDDPVESGIATKFLRGAMRVGTPLPFNARQFIAANITGDTNLGFADLSEGEQKAVFDSMETARKAGRKKTEYNDYNKVMGKDIQHLQGNVAGIVGGSALSSDFNAATTVGRVSFEYDPKTETYHAYDDGYNFIKTPNLGSSYSQVRNAAGELAEQTGLAPTGTTERKYLGALSRKEMLEQQSNPGMLDFNYEDVSKGVSSLYNKAKKAGSYLYNQLPSFEQGGLINNNMIPEGMTIINLQKNELLIDPKTGKEIRGYPMQDPHAKPGQKESPLNFVAAPVGGMIVPAKWTKKYTHPTTDNITKRSMIKTLERVRQTEQMSNGGGITATVPQIDAGQINSGVTIPNTLEVPTNRMNTTMNSGITPSGGSGYGGAALSGIMGGMSATGSGQGATGAVNSAVDSGISAIPGWGQFYGLGLAGSQATKGIVDQTSGGTTGGEAMKSFLTPQHTNILGALGEKDYKGAVQATFNPVMYAFDSKGRANKAKDKAANDLLNQQNLIKQQEQDNLFMQQKQESEDPYMKMMYGGTIKRPKKYATGGEVPPEGTMQGMNFDGYDVSMSAEAYQDYINDWSKIPQGGSFLDNSGKLFGPITTASFENNFGNYPGAYDPYVPTGGTPPANQNSVYPAGVNELPRFAQSNNPSSGSYADDLYYKSIHGGPKYGIGTTPAASTPPPRGPRHAWENRNDAMLAGSGAVLNSVGDIYDIYRGRKSEKVDYGRISPNLVSVDKALADVDRADSSNRYNIRRMNPSGGGLLGAYLANRLQSGRQKAAIRENVGNMNAGILNQTAMFNKNLDVKGRDATDANAARSRDLMRSGLGGLGKNAAYGIKDYQTSGTNQRTLDTLAARYGRLPAYEDLLMKYGYVKPETNG